MVLVKRRIVFQTYYERIHHELTVLKNNLVIVAIIIIVCSLTLHDLLLNEKLFSEKL